MKSFRKIILVASSMLLLNVLFTNCANISSQATTETTSPEGSPPVANGACSEAELQDLETEIKNTLATVSTDVDFSYDVVTEDGREIHYDRGASTMTATYASASSSKWPAATIILSFMESAANQNSSKPLRLNSKPQDFIDTAVWSIPSTDVLYNMNLRQLFSFTSGLTNQSNCLRPGSGALTPFWTCIEEIVSDNVGVGNVPGSQFDYNSAHLQVAGAMAIKARDIALGITGSTWQDLYSDFQARTNLFLNSSFDLPSSANPRLAGGMRWTGNDYMAFLRANYYSEILSDSTMPGETAPYFVQQFTDQIATAAIGNSPAQTNLQEDWHYGFGLWLACHSATFNCTDTVTFWSSPGSLGAFPFIDRENKFYGIIAREGGLATFDAGYAVFMSVSDKLNKWAKKKCSD